MTAQPGAHDKRFGLDETTIEELHAAIRSGQTTCFEIVQHYINRVRTYNGVASVLVTEDNRTTRAYDEKAAREIYRSLPDYAGMMRRLLERLTERSR